MSHASLSFGPLPNATPSDDPFVGALRRAQHYAPHPLHGPQMVWKQTNCYVDAWIEILNGWGLNPYAALPFTIALDFEGDQFTFFKFPPEDLDTLYGIVVQEHAIYEAVDVHVDAQIARGHLMLVEVDAYYLPDTLGASYRTQHTKTTIGIDAIDRAGRRIGYFHNSGYYVAEGTDYDGLFAGGDARLAPYVECVKRRFRPLDERALRGASFALLERYVKRLPARSPISEFRRALAQHALRLASSPLGYFHDYSFNTLRQLGANFELFGRYLRWLDTIGCRGEFDVLVAACDTIASESLVLEFRLARACMRGREEFGESCLDTLERAYVTVIENVVRIAPLDFATSIPLSAWTAPRPAAPA